MTDPTFSALQLLNYQDGLFLTASLLSTEQLNLVSVTRYQNRAMFSAGVVVGLTVTSTSPNQIQISGGFALDSLGNSLVWPSNYQPQPASGTSGTTLLVTLAFPTSPVTVNNFYQLVPTVALIPAQILSSTQVPIAEVTFGDSGQITVSTTYQPPKATLLIPVTSQPSTTTEAETVAPAALAASPAASPAATPNATEPGSTAATTESATATTESAGTAAAAPEAATPATASLPVVLYGSASIPVKASDKRVKFQQSVFYQTDQDAAFTAPPLVMITIQTADKDDSIYAAVIQNVTTSQFTVTLTNLTAITVAGQVQINWSAREPAS